MGFEFDWLGLIAVVASALALVLGVCLIGVVLSFDVFFELWRYWRERH